ncbi:hypothetical protein HDU76_009941 [Blyttiomyces sp. JEL0837]|nr:hypothetical protein HDU76_009941 [Blyttiomyces sp. JEL0837]
MVRTKQLTLLDDKFDEVIKGYDDDELGELDPEDPDFHSQMENGIPSSRINRIFDSFLESTEMVGRKRRILNKRIAVGADKFDEFRADLKEAVRALDIDDANATVDHQEGGDALDAQLEREIVELQDSGKEKERWDVETVLSTYSNIYNHPTLIKDIRAGAPKIRFSKGVPVVVSDQQKEQGGKGKSADEEDEDESEDEDEDGEPAPNLGEARKKNESKEEKKARKAAVKASRKERRAEKSATKEAFKKEFKTQKKAAAKPTLVGNTIPM